MAIFLHGDMKLRMYISFTLLTSNVASLRTFLINRGIAKIENSTLVGVLPGLEWVEVPNPTEGDTRRVFLVKLAHDTLANEIDGTRVDDTTDWLKIAKWVKANGVADVNPPSFRIGTDVWLVRDSDAGLFGAWQ